MKINTRVNGNSFIEVIIVNGSTILTVDVSNYKEGKGHVPEDIIENFITIANELSRFNRTSDVDFVYKIYEAFLSSGSERDEFNTKITKNESDS